MQGKAASFSRLAFYGNRTAHFIHQALDIEKPETIALDRIFIAIRHPIELVENIRQFIVGNTDSIIRYGNQHFILGFLASLDFYLHAIFRILDSIVYEIAHDV